MSERPEVVAGRRIAGFVEKRLAAKARSSTPEIVPGFYASAHLAPALTDVLVGAVSPARYDDQLGAVLDYRMPGPNRVRLVRDGAGLRRFVLLTEDGQMLEHADFVDWVRTAYLAAIAKDERVEQLMDLEINHLLAEFQTARNTKAVLRPHFPQGSRIMDQSVRRKSGRVVGPTPMAPFRTVAVGGRTKGIVGSPGDAFRLSQYPEVKRWMDEVIDAAFGTRYDWRLNPRRRKKLMGQKQTRPRWIFRVSAGISGAFVQSILRNLIRASADIVPSMNWKAVAPIYVPVISRTESMAADFAQILRTCSLPVVVGMSVPGHAIVGILRRRTTDGTLELIMIDPHAEITFDPKEVVPLLQQALPEMTISPISIREHRLLAVQYAREGSCGVSSLSIILAAARFLAGDEQGPRSDPININISSINPYSLAKHILMAVSDLDVVIASQLVHRVS
jgi:hypothetical protein